MKREIERIRDLIDRVHAGHAWHGPTVTEVLAGVTAEQAAARPIFEAHTIWELVRHMTAWEAVVRRRLEGEEVRDLPDDQNWPTIGDTTEDAWVAALDEYERGHRKLRQALSRLSDGDLGKPAPGQETSVYVMLHGIIHHNLYHAGQIALLKKVQVL